MANSRKYVLFLPLQVNLEKCAQDSQTYFNYAFELKGWFKQIVEILKYLTYFTACKIAKKLVTGCFLTSVHYRKPHLQISRNL